MKNIAIFSEHVELLYTCNRLHVQFLQRCLQLAVILATPSFRSLYHFTTRSALATFCEQSVSHCYLYKDRSNMNITYQFDWSQPEPGVWPTSLRQKA